MRELVWFLLGALCLTLFASWVARNRPHSAALAWQVLDGAARLPLFVSEEYEEPREGARQELRAGPQEALPEPVPLPSAKPRKRLTALMKKKIAARDKWRCSICNKLVNHTFEIDHIIPQSRGGGHQESNLRTLCRECHGTVTAEQRLK
jgi:hypothetical protein